MLTRGTPGYSGRVGPKAAQLRGLPPESGGGSCRDPSSLWVPSPSTGHSLLLCTGAAVSGSVHEKIVFEVLSYFLREMQGEGGVGCIHCLPCSVARLIPPDSSVGSPIESATT